MRKTFILISVVSLFSLLRCSNEEDMANFSGITETNEFAIVSGNIDESDWGVEESWTNQEASLFGLNLETINNNNSDIDFSSFEINPELGPAYPNPSKGLVLIQSLNIDFDKGELVLVDNRYNIIAGPINLRFGSEIQFEIEVKNQIASIFQSGELPPSLDAVNSGQILRAYYYYRIDNEDIYLKGHGDILFE